MWKLFECGHTQTIYSLALILFLSVAAAILSLGACTHYDFDEPDTLANQEGFERHFGFAVPASVSDLYYFVDELGADIKYQLGFRADQETVDRIACKLGLVQGDPELQVGLAYELDWWDVSDIEGLLPYWKTNPDKDYYWFLWYNPAGQRVYYIEFGL